MIKAVIFDMDGTMVETESLWRVVNEELAKKYGHIYTESIGFQMMGRKEDDALRIFKEYLHLDVSIDELQKTRKRMLFEKLDQITPNKGLFELVDLLDKLQIKKAIATSTFRDFASKVIALIGLKNRFEVFVTGDEVTKGKPDPEMFLTAANKLGVLPSESLVLEDAQNGVEAAYNAGMKVFAIPHIYSQHHDFSKATKILSSMAEIDEAMLKSL
ncbi:MAG: HAD family hydrolase [Candidatus Levyibacteriota bacterium]